MMTEPVSCQTGLREFINGVIRNEYIRRILYEKDFCDICLLIAVV